MTIIEHFSKCRQADPGRAILHVPASGLTLTRDDIWRQHRACAEQLRQSALEPGHVVVSAAGNRACAVPFFLACRAAGLALMAVDADTTMAEITELSDRYGAAARLLPGALPGVRGTPVFDDLSLVVASNHASVRKYPNTAAMKVTSGSTGVPKATLTSEDQLVVDSTQIAAGMGIAPGDTQMAVIPLSHAYGLSVLLIPLLLQGTAIVLRDSFVPQQFAADAARYGANSFPAVPYMFQHFLEHPPGAWPSGIRRIMSAGARLPIETARQFRERFGVKIHSFYGTTEGGGIAYDAGDDADDESVGSPLPGVTITCLPDEDAPEGSGRIHVRSGAVSNGYADSESDAFRDGGYLTGDYGRIDARGRLLLTGRVSSFVNVAGRKVQPSEVEQVLRLMPGIREVHVIAASDVHRGEHVVACIVAEPGHAEAIGILEVRRFCSARLAPFKMPRRIVRLEAMPLTARGKIDRQALDAMVRAELARST